jgi:hypothetical protein
MPHGITVRGQSNKKILSENPIVYLIEYTNIGGVKISNDARRNSSSIYTFY